MFRKLKQRKSLPAGRQGFTIIEVIIVLAIAGMILAIVFLAVPSLQRSQRNNARKQEASRVSSAVLEFGSNSGSAGTLPSTQADCKSVINLVTNLKQYSLINSSSCVNPGTAMPTNTTNGRFYLETLASGASAASVPAANSTDQVIILEVNTTCNNGGNGDTGYQAGKAALFYTLEGSTNAAWACTNVQ